MRDQQHPVSRVGKTGPAPADDLAQTAARPIALHGAADALAAGDEPDARGLGRPGEDEQQAVGAPQRAPLRLDGLDLARVAKAVRGGDALTALGGQDEETVRRFRPRLRRAESTFLPPLLFIRARKPCVFLRCRLRGRNVRFMRGRASSWAEERGLRAGTRGRAPGATRAAKDEGA